MVKPVLLSLPCVLAVLILAGCGSSTETANGSSASSHGSGGTDLKGAISIDGSSTVGPISEAIAEEFGKANPGVRPTVGISGTGGGFKKFANGEIDIAGASRPIEDKEKAACAANKVEFVEIPIAYDGLSIVVNPKNDFLKDITTAELKKIWQGNSRVKTWADVRAGFPAQPIKLYGPGSDNGTFDYFTEAICGKKGDSRTDYQASATPNTLIQGIAGDQYALAYFGFAYYEQNQDKLKLVTVNGVAPTKETILNGTYTPLSRPLFWYVKASSLDRPEVKAFVNFLLKQGKPLIESTGYIALPDSAYASGQTLVDGKKVGTRFKDGETGLKIEDVLNREPK